MIILYTSEDLSVIIPETYQENLDSQNGNFVWCTKDVNSYNLLTKTFKQVFILFMYSNGYVMSLVIDKNNRTFGQWVDNVIDGKTFASVSIQGLNGNPFDCDKLRKIAITNKSKGIDIIADRISELDIEVIEKIETFLNTN